MPNFNSASSQQNILDNILQVYPIPFWRLLLPLILQTGMILAVIAPNLYTQYTGKTIILQTTPQDPYDMLRGNYIALEYNISRIETLKNLPGWSHLINQYPGIHQQYFPVAEGTKFYVILHQQSTSPTWKPLRVTSTLPTTLPENQVALRASYRYGSIVYGLEKFELPQIESDLNKDILRGRQIRLGQKQPIQVKIKVDSQGNAVPMEMQVVDTSPDGKKFRIYEF
ncbi:MAG: GDYXXLXY domain-containing protein [Calothrix sp. C42_A2020_038]|nr:GDYXXLXY domain-containing protein [Calothrix sp. C42_A2020_038]